ncbi:MAG: 4Fe-4S binding protein [Lachnospiraceae bacterium]|nr:4Fe-4S binding protein [Lachnospiraceae bacterium]
MDKKAVRTAVSELYDALGGSILTEQDDIKQEYIGLRLLDAPLVGFGAAGDPLFEKYKAPGVIGPWHMSPAEWLPGAQTVISFFFPVSETIRRANAKKKDIAALSWAYARIEGQQFLGRFTKVFAKRLEEAGAAVCIPQSDPRWQGVEAGKGITGYPEINEATFGSRWSERHAAYVCGLGTFGLSKGLITEKGMAGRFASVITTLRFEPDARQYEGVYDYCIHCNACVRRCPVNAIDPEKGKDHVICHPFIEYTREVFKPRYGCGLCQTGVPCEAANPLRRI